MLDKGCVRRHACDIQPDADSHASGYGAPTQPSGHTFSLLLPACALPLPFYAATTACRPARARGAAAALALAFAETPLLRKRVSGTRGKSAFAALAVKVASVLPSACAWPSC